MNILCGEIMQLSIITKLHQTAYFKLTYFIICKQKKHRKENTPIKIAIEEYFFSIIDNIHVCIRA